MAAQEPLSAKNNNQQTIFILNSGITDTKPHPVDLFIQQVFTQLNIKITYRNTPSRRTYKEASFGLIDGTYPHIASITASHKNLVMVPEPIGMHQLVAVTTNPDINLSHGLTGLSKYKVAYVAGWVLIEPLIKGLHNTFTVTDQNTLFSMLKAKRFDVILCSRSIVAAYIKKSGSQQMRILDPVLRTDPMYLFIHQKHQKLVPLIEEKMRQLKKSLSRF